MAPGSLSTLNSKIWRDGARALPSNSFNLDLVPDLDVDPDMDLDRF